VRPSATYQEYHHNPVRFAQDYALLAMAIDLFTLLIYTDIYASCPTGRLSVLPLSPGL